MNNDRNSNDNKMIMIAIVMLALAAMIGLFVGGIFMGRKMALKSAEKALKASGAGTDLFTKAQNATGADLTDDGSTSVGTESGSADTNGSSNEIAVGEFADIAVDQTGGAQGSDVREGGTLQIVTLGDSIFDRDRDGTGIPYLVAESLDANIYNLAIGGTTATIEEGENTSNEEWTSSSGIGIAKVITGKVSPDALRDTTAKGIIKEHMNDFKDTDIFIVEFGINDFLADREIGNGEYAGDYHHFVTAMMGIVDTLSDAFPDAKIVLCEPHYCDFFGPDGSYLGSSNMFSNTYGTLFDYKGKVDYVANTKGTYLFEAYLESGINGNTAADYLLDGIHMTEAGRREYASRLSDYIKYYVLNWPHEDKEGEENN